MADDTREYVHRNPGDLITAEDWNNLQAQIKADIAKQVQQAKDEIKRTGVDHAGNADQFDTKTPTQWTDSLDQRYALKVHDHEGLAAYRRFIKEFAAGQTTCLLRHNLGRFPLVDVYELLPVVIDTDDLPRRLPDDEKDRYTDCKLLFYASHADADRLDLWVRVGRDRVPLGIPFEEMLKELHIEYDEARTIEDLLNDMANAFMQDPNDEISHCTTPWIDDCCERDRTVGDLKRSGLWDNLYVALRPRKCAKGADKIPPKNDEGDRVECEVEVRQVNYQTVYIEASQIPDKKVLDLMILLRS